jgi:hypothetical protein
LYPWQRLTCLAPPRTLQANGNWSLFCPNEAPGLADCWGPEFEALYTKYEKENRARRTIKAQQLWFAILEAQVGVWVCLGVCCGVRLLVVLVRLGCP